MYKQPLLKPLTDEERDILLPTLIEALEKRTNDMVHKKRQEIVDWFIANKEKIGFKQAFNLQRFMKLTNYIRANCLLPLCSTSDGYYVTRDKEKIKEMIASFKGRVESQQAAIRGLEQMLKDIEAEEELNGPFGITDWK